MYQGFIFEIFSINQIGDRDKGNGRRMREVLIVKNSQKVSRNITKKTFILVQCVLYANIKEWKECVSHVKIFMIKQGPLLKCPHICPE